MTIYRIDNNGRSLVYRVNTGSRGADGVSSYLHLAFADDNIGTGFNFIDGVYIGTLVDTEITSSGDPTDYTWHLFRGEPGPQGIQGPVGPSVNLSIGEVTDGDSASATITGTSPNLVLNLTLPKGEKGDPGVEGPQGPKGDQGEQGVQGEQGPKGDVGPSINLSIGTVQKGDNANASISGTSPNYSLNLTLPKGDKGDTGEQGPQGIQGPEGPQGEKGDQGIQGIQGQKGDKGDIGPAPNLSIGSVTSGQTASATVTGTNPNYQLNLVLPQGPKGDTGDQGPIGQTGPKGDQGETGPQGEKGEKGDTGNTGPAPNLTIGTIQGGASASATITGSNPNYVLNLTLPKGDKGDQGIQGPAGDKGETGATGPEGPQGQTGQSAGFGTPTASVSTLNAGSNATVSVSASGSDTAKVFAFTFGIPRGEQGIQGVQGPQGQKGETGSQGLAGYTPIKGTDYWTASDIQSIETDLKSYVDEQIGQINSTLDAINGEVV